MIIMVGRRRRLLLLDQTKPTRVTYAILKSSFLSRDPLSSLRMPKGPSRRTLSPRLLGLCLAGAALCCIFAYLSFFRSKPEAYFQEPFALRHLEDSPVIHVPSSAAQAQPRDPDCNFYNCFDVYKCGHSDNTISVYIYPIINFVDDGGESISVPHSSEFHEVLRTVYHSRYYTSDPAKACFFLPPLDLLNQESIRLGPTSKVLASLPHWNNGSNHLLFTLLPGGPPTYTPHLEVPTHRAINVGAGFSSWSFRRGLDVSLPVFNPNVFSPASCLTSPGGRDWLLTSSQLTLPPSIQQRVRELALDHPDSLLMVGSCPSGDPAFRCRDSTLQSYPYPALLARSKFCLVSRGGRLGQMALSDALMYGCVPVIVADNYVLPFQEVLDWKRAAVIFGEEEVGELVEHLASIPDSRVAELRSQACFLWDSYFHSMEAITLTTLRLLNDRVFPHTAASYHHWNDPPHLLQPPLFLPMVAPRAPGFTAVILTYDRLESLFQVIRRVAQAPSLAKILVVWNNLKKNPPPAANWPAITKPLKVVQTEENKLSNRFYPYEEIETDAVLAMDDDIIMLTADEIEFGFSQVWREYFDRIVGFPSRVHLWDNSTGRWKYESEWTNDISMVLTGAAFYHRYYNQLYTTSMPGDIKEWVDTHMNCEDIAMNFLVANLTGKAPIKVAPRKKFKCPECTNVEMLSADLLHMAERSRCINRFAQIYGTMPLRTVEFRADPVLYKDNFPEKLKKFNSVGSL
ncbi:EXT2 [Cordylochernes scorpioides]|uniref:EXT2 n=1 Tax=Cordylochernes scorpioides TaxID=51811 RepID=A0ABY6KSH2_9ARAC|nr:EXT2 [Cordylochernes scorpioides]